MSENMNEELIAVKRLGELIGYGNMMSLASRLWNESLKENGYPTGGEFVVGPCAAMTVPCGCEKLIKCDWCEATGWLTKLVKEVKDREEIIETSQRLTELSIDMSRISTEPSTTVLALLLTGISHLEESKLGKELISFAEKHYVDVIDDGIFRCIFCNSNWRTGRTEENHTTYCLHARSKEILSQEDGNNHEN